MLKSFPFDYLFNRGNKTGAYCGITQGLGFLIALMVLSSIKRSSSGDGGSSTSKDLLIRSYSKVWLITDAQGADFRQSYYCQREPPIIELNATSIIVDYQDGNLIRQYHKWYLNRCLYDLYLKPYHL